MKRYISAIVAFFIMFAQVALADFDYFSMKGSLSPDDYDIIEEEDNGNSFIAPDFFTMSERSFDHKGQSDYYYSYFENDWIVIDYDKLDSKPIRRLWIYLSSKEVLNISSITFTFNNNICAFSNFFRPSLDITKYDNGDSLQTICLVMGNESAKFHDAILQYILSQDDTAYETIMNLQKIKMTLHGTEDIEVELPNTFILDYSNFPH